MRKKSSIYALFPYEAARDFSHEEEMGRRAYMAQAATTLSQGGLEISTEYSADRSGR